MEEKILQAIQDMKEEFIERFDSLETQVRENTGILKVLEHSAEINRGTRIPGHCSAGIGQIHLEGGNSNDLGRSKKDLS